MSDEHGHAPHYEPEGDFEFTNGKMAMWLFLVSDAMAFIGFLGAYMVLRMGATMDTGALEWQPPWSLKPDVFLTGLNTFVLIFSSVTMVKAFSAIQEGKIKRFRQFLLGTILGGAFFVGFQCYEWTHFIHQGITMQGLEVPELDVAMVRAQDWDPDMTRLEMAERLYGKRDLSELEDKQSFTDQEFLECSLITMTEFEEDERPLVPGVIHRPDYGVPAQGHTEWKDGQPVGVTTRDKLTSADLRAMDPDEMLEQPATVANLFSSTFFLLTGFHGFHVFLGVIYMLVIMARSFRGAYDENKTSPIEIAGLYWHFVDLVWVLLFMVIYLI